MSLYAVGVDLGTMQAAAAAPKLIRGSKTYTGAANLGATGVNELFTTTGAVLLDGFWVRCTTDLVDAVDGAEFTLGVTGSAACFWDGTTSTGDTIDLDAINAGDLLFLADGGASVGDGIGGADPVPGPAAGRVIVDNIIQTISVQNITGGVLVFYVLYRPLSADGALALGAGMVAV